MSGVWAEGARVHTIAVSRSSPSMLKLLSRVFSNDAPWILDLLVPP